tara:strand:+ start:1805 stop:2074 length:270 start_codon:yes stop_codon:yes gene_type:complete
MEFRWGYNCVTIREGKNFKYEIQWILTGSTTGRVANRSGWLNSTPIEIHGEFTGFPEIRDEDYISFIKTSLYGNITRLKNEIREELREE